jgi:hypothetical protein
MPAKSFIGELQGAVRHFYSVELRHEVSDANVRGYLRAATQIEDVWQQIDDRLAALMAQGVQPWDAYAGLRYPLAFIRAARTYQMFVHELLAADGAADPASDGYVPRITFDQANALCHHILPNLQYAIAALYDPAYQPEVALPLRLGPRIEAEKGCPLAHLQGMLAAAREVRTWVAGLIAQYSNAVSRADEPPPEEITRHMTALESRLAQADSQLRFGIDLVGHAFQRETSAELHEHAEDSLWAALRGYFLLNQAVSWPELLCNDGKPVIARRRSARHRAYRDRRIRPRDLWRIAAPGARAELRDTEFGRDEMTEMAAKMGHTLTSGAQRYLDDAEQAVVRGGAYIVAAMATCPFEPLYRARTELSIVDARIPVGYEFHWNFHRGRIEISPRFPRTKDWQECEE